MKLTEKTINKNYIYKGKIINLRVDEAELPNQSIAKREVVEHNGGVSVAAITENNEILMVKQFRYPYGEIIYEIPAGKRDGNEDPLTCGKRELKEETKQPMRPLIQVCSLRTFGSLSVGSFTDGAALLGRLSLSVRNWVWL